MNNRRAALPSGGLRPPLAQRSGFTLIELLVVIAIIGILAALIVGATMRVIGVQAQKNTQLLVQKVADAVNAQWKATVEQANNEAIPPAVIANAGGDMMVARANYINLRLAQQFPQSYAEAINGPGFGIPARPLLCSGDGGGGGDPPAVQNAACLWLSLKNSRSGAIFNQDIFTPRETMASSRAQCLYLVDDWKQPLGFQRAPYSQVWPQGGGGPIPFDLPIQFYLVPQVWSNGGPAGVQIYSNQITIGGFSGG